MNSRKQTARLAGVLYLVMGLAGAFGLLPAYYRVVFKAVRTPAAALGEMGLVLWLLIKGAREEVAAS